MKAKTIKVKIERLVEEEMTQHHGELHDSFTTEVKPTGEHYVIKSINGAFSIGENWKPGDVLQTKDVKGLFEGFNSYDITITDGE